MIKNISFTFSLPRYLNMLPIIIILKGMSKVNCFDTNKGSKDNSEDDCDWYYQSPEACGMFDDDDFQARTMCCACRNAGLSVDAK